MSQMHTPAICASRESDRPAALKASKKKDNAGLLAPPPLLFGAFFAVACLLNRLHGLGIPIPPIGRNNASAMLIDLSGLLAGWAAMYMLKARTPINPRRATMALVTSGPYRFSRNPLSLAILLIYMGMAFSLDTSWPLLLLPMLLVVYHFGVVRREEAYLIQKFGEPYRVYCARVRRWI